MLRDRRALLEHDLKEAHDRASNMYLDIVTNDGDVHSIEYQRARDQTLQGHPTAKTKV